MIGDFRGNQPYLFNRPWSAAPRQNVGFRSSQPLGGHTASKGQTKVEIDWNSVRKPTLWCYEVLISKFLSVLAYNFVQEHYNHTMKQAQGYARKIRRGYLQNRGGMTAYVDSISHSPRKAGSPNGSETYSENYSPSRNPGALCGVPSGKPYFDFDQLIQTLNYLLRWVLPFRTLMREFIDADSDVDAKYLEALKKQKIN